MNRDRDPFDGPSPVGPLGEAMARLAEEAPAAGFSASTIRHAHDSRRSGRWNVLGSVAAGMVAIALLVLVAGLLVRGGADTATTTGAANALLSSAGSSAAESSAAASAAGSGSTSSAATSAGAAPQAGGDGTSPVPPGGAGTGGASGDQPPDAPTDASCRPAALTDAELAAVESAVPGLTRGDSCAGDAVSAQRYAVAGGTLLVERRAAGYDPCAAADGATCADVPGHPGVRTTAGAVHQVWINGPGSSVVLTATPVGAVPLATLAAAAEALIAAGP